MIVMFELKLQLTFLCEYTNTFYRKDSRKNNLFLENTKNTLQTETKPTLPLFGSNVDDFGNLNAIN